jgi:hypothetical protein
MTSLIILILLKLTLVLLKLFLVLLKLSLILLKLRFAETSFAETIRFAETI